MHMEKKSPGIPKLLVLLFLIIPGNLLSVKLFFRC